MNDFNLIFDSFADLAKNKSQLLKENLFLRQQIIILARSVKKVKIRKSDRLFFVFFRRFLSNWRECLYIFKPATVIGWHRRLARSFWRWYSKAKTKPKVRISQETKELVRQLASANRLWGAEKIRGELLKIAIKLSKPTILKIIRPLRKELNQLRSQNWSTFLKNHAPHIWAADFFTATTIGFKQFYVFVIMAIHSRKILHFAITDHPTSDWTYRQVLQTTWDHPAPRYLLIDRDNKYSGTFRQNLKNNLGIKVLRTPYKAPKANAFCERLIGSIRRECLDHFIVFCQKHLRKILIEYVDYYNHSRPHQGIDQRIPNSPDSESPPTGSIRCRPVLNGLHHHYYRKAA